MVVRCPLEIYWKIYIEDIIIAREGESDLLRSLVNHLNLRPFPEHEFSGCLRQCLMSLPQGNPSTGTPDLGNLRKNPKIVPHLAIKA